MERSWATSTSIVISGLFMDGSAGAEGDGYESVNGSVCLEPAENISKLCFENDIMEPFCPSEALKIEDRLFRDRKYCVVCTGDEVHALLVALKPQAAASSSIS